MEQKYEMKVLVVEDDASFREALCSLLEEEGYKAVPAQNGVEALLLARKVVPDAIVLDAAQPHGEATALLEQLDADPCLAGIPRFALTLKEIANIRDAAGVPLMPRVCPQGN